MAGADHISRLMGAAESQHQRLGWVQNWPVLVSSYGSRLFWGGKIQLRFGERPFKRRENHVPHVQLCESGMLGPGEKEDHAAVA